MPRLRIIDAFAGMIDAVPSPMKRIFKVTVVLLVAVLAGNRISDFLTAGSRRQRPPL
jgi:hypothetical protein